MRPAGGDRPELAGVAAGDTLLVSGLSLTDRSQCALRQKRVTLEVPWELRRLELCNCGKTPHCHYPGSVAAGTLALAVGTWRRAAASSSACAPG